MKRDVAILGIVICVLLIFVSRDIFKDDAGNFMLYMCNIWFIHSNGPSIEGNFRLKHLIYVI